MSLLQMKGECAFCISGMDCDLLLQLSLSRKAMASSCVLSKRSSFVLLKYGYSTYRTYPDKLVMRTAIVPTKILSRERTPFALLERGTALLDH